MVTAHVVGIASLLMFPEEDSADSSQQDDEDSEADTEPLDTEELGLGDEQLERRGSVYVVPSKYLAIISALAKLPCFIRKQVC